MQLQVARAAGANFWSSLASLLGRNFLGNSDEGASRGALAFGASLRVKIWQVKGDALVH